MIYHTNTIGKQTHIYKMSDILNILNQFNNTPENSKNQKKLTPITSLDAFVARDIKEILKPKISIIMQSYLGEYNGSRTNAIDKFIRAVDSFNNQIYNCKFSCKFNS